MKKKKKIEMVNNMFDNVWVLSWCLSTISNILWLVIFLPQLHINYRLKNAEAISLSLLLLLIYGESIAIIGAISKNLHIIVILTGLYHIFFELILVIQILYYRTCKNKEIEPLISNYKTITKLEILLIIIVILSNVLLYISLYYIKDDIYKIVLGDCLAWIATSIFMCSRVPQIILNYQRQTTDGLAILSFVILIISSIFYLVSILLVNKLVDVIQWVIGISFSLLFFDTIIIYQFVKYKKITE